jgi:hypothetical protein
MAPYASNADTLSYPFPDAGIISSSPCLFVPLPSHKQQGGAGHASHIDITVVGADQKLVKMCNYPTLRRGITHPSNVTERSMHDLPTVLCNTTIAHEQIRNLTGTDIPDRLQGLVVPNVQYLEWLMGYPADWTKVDGPLEPRQLIKYNIDKPSACPSSTLVQLKPRPKNGMHMFIKDNPGKDVRQIAILWRELPEETKDAYKAKAKAVGC